jgi:DNA modification methylase
MAHFSENCARLDLQTVRIDKLTELKSLQTNGSEVILLWLPWGRTAADAKRSTISLEAITSFSRGLKATATVCLLTTPPDAASILSSLEQAMKFRLWVAVKTVRESHTNEPASIPQRHVSLIILTRYNSSLRHVPTRIKYTHCPACGKTTKDYGGKTHMYHRLGTLMSDVWTDIACDPQENISEVTGRLQDLFGLAPYKRLLLVDLRKSELVPVAVGLIEGKKVHKRNPAQDKRAVRSRLINEDCMEALINLRSDSIDFCFADLPYNLKKKYYRSNDSLEPAEYFQWCNEWLSELCRVLKPGRTLAVLNVPQWAGKHFSFLSSIMEFQAWIVWDALGFPARKIMPAHYSILCFSKGAPRALPGLTLLDESSPESLYLRHRKELYCIRPSCVSRRRVVNDPDYSPLNDIWSDIHRLTHNSRRVNHPCQLPPLLMRRLFALFTFQEEVILDCFNGAGTSTLVARQMSRRFLGIEISKRYHALASKRHEMLDHGDDPFGKKDKVPIAKNSPVIRLPKQDYKVTKKVLQLDVQRIAAELGRIPKREDVRVHSTYPIKYFDNYFSSWGEVCAAARTETGTGAPT